MTHSNLSASRILCKTNISEDQFPQKHILLRLPRCGDAARPTNARLPWKGKWCSVGEIGDRRSKAVGHRDGSPIVRFWVMRVMRHNVDGAERLVCLLRESWTSQNCQFGSKLMKSRKVQAVGQVDLCRFRAESDPYVWEELLPAINPIAWNWPRFCGARITINDALLEHSLAF
jgi:hypothetical protein